MKRLFVISAMLMIIMACKKDDAPRPPIKEYAATIETYAASNPTGFMFDVESNKPAQEGYAIDLGGNNQDLMGVSLEDIIEKSLEQDNMVAGWLDLDNQMVYRNMKVINDYDKAVAYAKQNNVDVMYDIKNQLPVYTSTPDEFQVGKSIEDGAVKIEAKDDKYYFVTINFAKEKSFRKIGESYGKCVTKLNLWYVRRVKTYLAGSVWEESLWGVLGRMNDIKKNLNQEYKDLIEGFASELPFSGFPTCNMLMYGANLLPDTFRPTACSAYGVMPEMSETGNTMVHRNLDWPDVNTGLFPKGREGIVAPLQSVTKMIFENKVIYSFGLLGLFNAITAIDATNGNMVGILDSGVKGAYSSSGKRSYVFDLMTALREKNNTDDIAAQMLLKDRKYAFNHLILLADKNKVRIVENNMLTDKAVRAVRSSDSKLAAHVTPAWDIPNVIGAVNCFMLDGQINNFNDVSGKELNSQRWQQQVNRTKFILGSKPAPAKLSLMDIRSIECYNDGDLGKEWYKNLYNSLTFQMIEYIPQTKEVHVFFKPFNASAPSNPKSMFVTVPIPATAQ